MHSPFIAKFHILQKSTLFICFVIATGWQILFSIIGFLVDRHTHSPHGFFAHIVNWDGGWYITILHDWYKTNLASAAFYPLYPLTLWIIGLCGLIPTDIAGIILNTLCLWITLFTLYKITAALIGKQYAYLPIIFLLSSPAVFFMHLLYTESLFMAIGLLSYLAALQKKWVIMGILLMFAMACRLPGILFVLLGFFEFMRSHTWRLKSLLTKEILVFLFVPVGFTLYGLYLWTVQRDFFGMFHAYAHTQDWTYQKFNPDIFETILRITYQIGRSTIGMRPFDYDIFINHALPFVALSLTVTSSIYLLVKKERFLPLGLYSLFAVILFTLNSNIVSVHRYTLPIIGIYIALTLVWIRYIWARNIIIVGCIASIFLQLYLFSKFIQHIFAG